MQYFKNTAPATKKLSRGIRSPVTTTRNDHCKVTLPWYEICNASTVLTSEALNIDITAREINVPAMRFCNPHELLCLPCILQRVEILR